MTRILAIETSSETCSAALDIGGGVREVFEHAPMKHAELILPAVSSLLAEAGIRVADLDAIAFGRGPGSFTSLRIGIGVVQGLAWGAEVPVVPVSSLAAVAQAVPGKSAGQRVLVAMDARMGEVFNAVFEIDPGGVAIAAGEERVCAPCDVKVEGQWIAAGNGFERFDELATMAAGAKACHADTWPRASKVLELAQTWLLENDPLPAGLAQPVYIRNDVAEKPKARQ